MSENLITLEHVSKVYRVGEENFSALNDVSLEVSKGVLKSGKKDGRLFRETDDFNGTESAIGMTLVNYF